MCSDSIALVANTTFRIPPRGATALVEFFMAYSTSHRQTRQPDNTSSCPEIQGLLHRDRSRPLRSASCRRRHVGQRPVVEHVDRIDQIEQCLAMCDKHHCLNPPQHT